MRPGHLVANEDRAIVTGLERYMVEGVDAHAKRGQRTAPTTLSRLDGVLRPSEEADGETT